VSLISAADCRFGETRCPECHGHATVIPGCVYSEEDVPLFEDLKGHVLRADLATLDVWELAAVLDRLRLSPEGAGPSISVLVEYLPSLELALTTLASHPERMRRGLNMLATLVKQCAIHRVSRTTDVPRALLRQHA